MAKYQVSLKLIVHVPSSLEDEAQETEAIDTFIAQIQTRAMNGDLGNDIFDVKVLSN